jgi:hypothetical protein
MGSAQGLKLELKLYESENSSLCCSSSSSSITIEKTRQIKKGFDCIVLLESLQYKKERMKKFTWKERNCVVLA